MGISEASWRLSDFDYTLPTHLIANEPLAVRGDSRLMVVSRGSGTIRHAMFSDLPSWLLPSDVMVLNDTKVMKARLLAKRHTGGKVEVFLLRFDPDAQVWEAMLSPQRALNVGERLIISDDYFVEVVAKGTGDDFSRVRFWPEGSDAVAMAECGQVPLPPYMSVDNPNQFEANYQTVWASQEGAVAAPTAGLHFTPGMMDRLHTMGIETHAVTLHVGYGTFAPMKTEILDDHVMHAEWYNVEESVAKALTRAKSEGRRVVGVGTTVARTLESVWGESGCAFGPGQTRLFIQPGYDFRGIDVLLTNFHLPKSTLLVLVASLCGHNTVMRAYQEAIDYGYRFYSFGDAMLILP